MILEAAFEVKDPIIHFLFVGDGAMKSRLLNKKKELNLTNVTMLDMVSSQEVSQYISLSNCALVPLKKTDTFKTVIPSKIFENAAMGKPIILGVEGESKTLVEGYGVGVFFEPENKADLINKIELLLKDRLLYQKCQKNCQQLAADFDRVELANKMYKHILEVVHAKNSIKDKGFSVKHRTTST